MVFDKAKIFWKISDIKKEIVAVPYDNNIEYYTFLRQCKQKGYRQVVITSEIMLQVIRYACLENANTVYKIELAEEDTDLEQEIHELLVKIDGNRAYLGDLMDKLKFLSERSSIDLRRVYIKSSFNGEFSENFFIQSNGILGINKESYEKLSEKLCTVIERCLIG